MVTVYYRTDVAIQRDPLAIRDSFDHRDYKFITVIVGAATPEDAFRLMNVVEGDELPVGLGVRSMMTGDVAVDSSGDVWLCSIAGWKRLHSW